MKWDDVISSAISGGLSLAGIPWQQNMQKELMHENEAINIAQWNRENEYNSPKAQMARLKEAGLNPDLAISGNVANTAGSAQLTAGTPQAPGAASAVSQAVRNAQAGAMVDSEIQKNQSEAERNNAQASVYDVDARFKNATFGLGIERLCADIGFTKQQTMESIAKAQYFDMSCAQLATSISKMNAEIRLTNAMVQGQYQLNRSYGFKADILMKELTHWDETFKLHVDETISNIGLNNAQAGLFRAQNLQITSTLKSYQLYMTNLAIKTGWEGAYYFHQKNYSRLLGQQLEEQIGYMPFIYADAVYSGSKFLQHNDDGSLVLDKNGHPIAKDGANLDYVLERGQQGVQILEGFSKVILNTGLGIGAIKGNINFGGYGPTAPSSPKTRPATDAEDAMFVNWYNKAKAEGKFNEAFKRVQEYKRAHNIE